MKPLAALALLATLAIAGCADPLEKPLGEEAQEKFQRGITGQGRLGTLDRPADDPANNHGVQQPRP